MKNFLAAFLFFINIPVFCQQDLSSFVDPMTGTGGHGHTFPGATLPFGMVQLSPDTRTDGSWDGCSGYHYSDSVIFGFSHTHLSGTGCSDFGDIMLMPVSGKNIFTPESYASEFSHKDETAFPGFYSVLLKDENIFAELTATKRVGFHRYHFQNATDAGVLIDLSHRDKLLEGNIRVINDSTISVFRRSEAWAKDQHVYARIIFSKKFTSEHYFENNEKVQTNEKSNKAVFYFNLDKNEPLLVKVSLSMVDEKGAEINLKTELPGWNFEETKINAQSEWNRELSAISVSNEDPEKTKIFYTALYHTMIHPNVYSDTDGRYRGRDNKIHTADGFEYYSVFSLWDTFRALHPLFTIIQEKRTTEFIRTFIAQYEQSGRLPMWELASNETDCMIGYHSVSVITDAAVKGIKGFDASKALEAMKASSLTPVYGIPEYIENNGLSMEHEPESVSKTLEYAYDDWCIAQMESLLQQKKSPAYETRQFSWINVIDRKTGFARPRTNGGWLFPFDPREVNNNYTEANSWQYSFFVPHDINRLITVHGGPENFSGKLDSLFNAPEETTGRDQADITGLIGQYAHGNEPSHHIAYLYNFSGEPWKTQEKVNQILTTLYTTGPEGLPGNEDCGQMSAWYVMSAMGIYPVTPGKPEYSVTTPLFNEIKIRLQNGKYFSINRKGHAPGKIFSTGFSVNNKKRSGWKILHSDIISGGEMTFEMTDKKSAVASFSPLRFTPEEFPVPSNPVITSSGPKVFETESIISITTNGNAEAEIFYNMDDGAWKKYSGPFKIDTTITIRAYCRLKNGVASKNTVSRFYRFPNDYTVSISGKYNTQYSAGGDKGIIDGLRGEVNWRKGGWQGYQGQDFSAVIDLGKEKEITSVTTGFLQDTRSWIVFPTRVDVYISQDGKNFIPAGSVRTPTKAENMDVRIEDLSVECNKATARYIKVTAGNFSRLPSWHPGAGGEAFIFVDEIIIK